VATYVVRALARFGGEVRAKARTTNPNFSVSQALVCCKLLHQSALVPVLDMIPPTKLVIGLIGGMGGGKSELAGLLAERGARVVSGDEAGHRALRQSDVKALVVKRWGEGILSPKGDIDRRKLACIVFGQEQERKALEEIVFPWIKDELHQQIAQAKADPNVPLIVLDAAIMLEAGWHKECDRLVFIEAPRTIRLARLKEKRGWSPAEVEDREKAQWPLSEKRAHADEILDNSGTLDHLAAQVDRLLAKWGIVLCNRP
jgi:dephospho-CoA kinase